MGSGNQGLGGGKGSPVRQTEEPRLTVDGRVTETPEETLNRLYEEQRRNEKGEIV